MEVDEINETLDNKIIGILSEAIEEYSFVASAIRRHSTEIKERHRSRAEKDVLRVAKHHEWGSCLDNKVVHLVDTEPIKCTATVKVHGFDVDILDPSNTGLEPPVLDEKAEAMEQRLKETSTVAGKTVEARLVLLEH